MGIVQIITTRVIPRRGATQSGVGWTGGMNLTGVARNKRAWSMFVDRELLCAPGG